MRSQRRAERAEQRRRRGASTQLLPVVIGERRGSGRCRSVKTAQDLDGPELPRLQSGCGLERVAEFEESLGRQGFEHAQLPYQQLVDAGGAVQWCHRCLRPARPQLSGRAVELVKDQLEPELEGLMNDHEEHLVMRALGERVLQVEQLVDAQVRAVVSSGHDRGGTPRSLAHPMGRTAGLAHAPRVTRMSSSENSSGGES